MPYESKQFPHGLSVRNPDTYEALKRKGYSKSKAAAISNAELNRTGKRGKHRSSRPSRRH